MYSMTREEITKGLANRFVHSQAYILLYLGMAALSVTTVVLSMVNGCPTLPFYVLEFIINGAMILEVAIRFIAFGRQFWKSPFNVMDSSSPCFVWLPCSSYSLQDAVVPVKRRSCWTRFYLLRAMFSSSAGWLRSCGNLSTSRRNGYTLDIDMEDDEHDDELGRPLIRDSVLFDAGEGRPAPRAPLSTMPRAEQAVRDRDDEDVWAELG
ncbi:hypothetical protein B0H21DRAFT_406446 [Amylocystis lapponica]|nr:hypothetical protein B0H21DRAFT_406446 [Amylocystis lapponica]